MSASRTVRSAGKPRRGGRGGARPKARGRADPRRRIRPKADVFDCCFPRLTEGGATYGVGVLLAVAIATGEAASVATCRGEAWRPKPGESPRRALLQGADAEATSRLLNGLAHRARLSLATAIFLGSHTHRLLAQASGLKTGPLYHHLRELQRAGIIESTDRNSYGLTEAGARLLLVAVAFGSGSNGSRQASWRTHGIALCRRLPRKPRRAKARSRQASRATDG